MSFFSIKTKDGLAEFKKLDTEQYQVAVRDFSRHLIIIKSIADAKIKLETDIPKGYGEKLDRILQEQTSIGERAFQCFCGLLESAQIGEKKIQLSTAIADPLKLIEHLTEYIQAHKLPQEVEKKIETSSKVEAGAAH